MGSKWSIPAKDLTREAYQEFDAFSRTVLFEVISVRFGEYSYTAGDVHETFHTLEDAQFYVKHQRVINKKLNLSIREVLKINASRLVS